MTDARIERTLLDLRAELVARIDSVLAQIDPAKYRSRTTPTDDWMPAAPSPRRSTLFAHLSE